MLRGVQGAHFPADVIVGTEVIEIEILGVLSRGRFLVPAQLGEVTFCFSVSVFVKGSVEDLTFRIPDRVNLEFHEWTRFLHIKCG